MNPKKQSIANRLTVVIVWVLPPGKRRATPIPHHEHNHKERTPYLGSAFERK